MPPFNVGVLIAASGKSERMGRDKALLPMFGQSLLACTVNTISRIKPSCFYITLPSHLIMNESLKHEMDLSRKIFLINRYPHQGYGGSIKTILEDIALTHTLDGMLIMPVDAPIFTTPLIVAMINWARIFKERSAIIVPYFHYWSGHPVYISKHFFNAFNKSEINSLRELIHRKKKYLHALFWPDPAVLLNLNYWQDFAVFYEKGLKKGIKPTAEAPDPFLHAKIN